MLARCGTFSQPKKKKNTSREGDPREGCDVWEARKKAQKVTLWRSHRALIKAQSIYLLPDLPPSTTSTPPKLREARSIIDMSLRTATRALMAPARNSSTSAMVARPATATKGLALASSSSSSPSSSLLLHTRSWQQTNRLATRPSSLALFRTKTVSSVSASIRAIHTTSPVEFKPTSTAKANEKPSESHTHSKPEVEPEADSDAPPPKASLRERLKFLTRRYGWWALGVYLAASAVDFSLVFFAIHMLGADHIRSLEASLRKSIGLEQRSDDETSSEPVKGTNPIWTEAVLAYTIHKTLLLPVRVAFTAAVTPSFVKWLVRMGWAKANHVVKAQVGRKAADRAIQDVVKRNAAKHQ